MTWKNAVRATLCALVWGVATAGSALAQDWVSIKGNTVNMRSGPSTNDPVLWELAQGFPLQVVERQDGWVKVRDFENDEGWVSAPLVGKSRHHIVKSSSANIRSGPSTRNKIVGKASYGDVLRTIKVQGDWAEVQHGRTKGWISQSLLWGW